MKSLLIGLMLVLSFSVQAREERVVFDLWDEAFGYRNNNLKVIENENEYIFISSGKYLEIYENLLDYSQNPDAQRLRELITKVPIKVELTIKIPKANVIIDEKNVLVSADMKELKAVIVAYAAREQFIISDIVIDDYLKLELVDVRILSRINHPTILSTRVLQITLNVFQFGVAPILLHQTVDQHY